MKYYICMILLNVEQIKSNKPTVLIDQIQSFLQIYIY